MNFHRMLQKRAAEGKSCRVGLIGLGKFASMFVSQVRNIPGLHLVGVADLSPERARTAFARIGWEADLYAAASLEEAAKSGKTCIISESKQLIASPFVDIIVEATGSPEAAIPHVLACCEHKKHIIMVTVEADAVAGPYLARKAQEAGIVYSLAYGDQPAEIYELVDWARTSGFEVVAAGKGTKYLPGYHQSTPDTVWEYFGISPEDAKRGGLNAKMFNSFMDGTKSAIEMASVANACDLHCNPAGLQFLPCGVDDLQQQLIPQADGGQLPLKGQVEIISSEERDGRHVFRDLRYGVYVVFKGKTEYQKNCFHEYKFLKDKTGMYTAMYRPNHLIGLELSITIATIAIHGEATGAPIVFNGDVVATAKKDLAAGDILDGEGGYAVYGKLMPAKDSLAVGGVPLGLCNNVKLLKPVKAGDPVTWGDVAIDETSVAVKVRKEMETYYKNGGK
ncbi:conserved hypothetical protein [uncultured delta proteobacterium]|uniref:SAF domain-containing protein n=1 Tax=uncultured delta proteobacterium TaxID=34034 RepID=A0A212JCV7_9DELT|nr:conserved hypothetical protein [uncultured delta proteobacterium]